MINYDETKYIILFDGVCNLCDASVQFVIKHDKQNRFLFAPLQGKTAEIIMETFKAEVSNIDSILLFTPEKKLLSESSAALKIASKLGFPLNIAIVFFLVPKFLRDVVYRFVAKHRYNWFGKKEVCLIPDASLVAKFLD